METLSRPSQSHFRTVFVLSAAVLIVVMNTTMFNIALPNILREFTLLPSEGAWIVSGYSIVLSIFTITFTRLSDYLPIRKLLTIGITIFSFASILGFFAESYLWLMIARLCQAVGAAAVPGLSMVFAGRYIPASRRGSAYALIASSTSLGFGLGPVIGGVVTDYLDWNYLFIVTILAVGVLPALFRLMPKETTGKGRFDGIGAFLSGSSATFFLLYISSFSTGYLLGGLLTAALLWLRINKTDTPFIQPELLADAQYRKILILSFLGFTLHFAVLFLMPVMLEQVYGQSAAAIGFFIFPGAILSAVAAIFIGRMIDAYGNIRVLILSQLLLSIAALAYFLLAGLHPSMIMIAYMFTSFGFSSLSSSSTNEVSQILPKEQIGAGIGLKQQIHFIGSATGSVLAGILLEMRHAPYGKEDFDLPFGMLVFLMTLSFSIFLLYAKKKKAMEKVQTSDI
ncbi:MFS transporter [Halobacillus sp. ACCC02827]|uniref:MFS transporter n=1 Tax=Bacillaceae TaxID=186817 RepID=UPI000428FE5B|nr:MULTISPECIES: MFS transporter [Bacillaceae]QHT48313.1 MFS transporter [Bacillus sp. SB49]WJE15551.1 MFS transporter [Halobacillus sp. ACCC02827]